jgi:hypothetical protein
MSGGKAEPHLQADQVAGHVDRAEDQAHGKTHGETDQHLLCEDQQAGPDAGSSAGIGGSRRERCRW